jgi:uncharacterized protein YjbJ (UPF0337 family)
VTTENEAKRVETTTNNNLMTKGRREEKKGKIQFGLEKLKTNIF